MSIRNSCTTGVLVAALLLGGGIINTRAPRTAASETGVERRIEAARLMDRSLQGIRRLRESRNLPIDPEIDPNRTGIIGEEFTPLTTSVGEADTKRTSANPAFAAVMVDYFRQARLEPGDVVAVGASGSFPALTLATLCAARVLDLEPVVIYSIGSSMFGANIPGFTFVDMLARLRYEGLLPYGLAAVSPGGNGDNGSGVIFDERGDELLAETRRSGLPSVGGASLADSIQRRMHIYEEAAGSRGVRCFVNIGGASANFGETQASLKLRNGLLLRVSGPPLSPTRGLVFEFAARGVPVVHLLNVRGLVRDNGLPFDPVPFPRIGYGEVFKGQ